MITPSFGLTATERVLPKLALDFTTANLDTRVTFTRTTDAINPATYVNSSGYVTAATNNQPRFDYNLGTGGDCKGLLIEESRTNLITNSSNFSAWSTQTSVNLTSGIDDPSGGTNAYTLTATADGGIIQTATTILNATAYSGSIYIRRRNGTGTVNIRVANLTAIPVTVTSSWTRVSATATSTSTTGRLAVQLATNGDAVDIWGAQLEAGAFATSYIPTTTTALTRNADVATMTGTNFSSWYNATEGSFEIQTNIPSLQSGPCFLSINNNTTNERCRITATGTSATRFSSITGGVTTAQIDKGGLSSGNLTFSCAYKLDNFGFAVNGGTTGTDLSSAVATVSQLDIGNDRTLLPMSGTVKKLMYWPQRLTNAELQAFSK